MKHYIAIAVHATLTAFILVSCTSPAETSKQSSQRSAANISQEALSPEVQAVLLKKINIVKSQLKNSVFIVWQLLWGDYR